MFSGKRQLELKTRPHCPHVAFDLVESYKIDRSCDMQKETFYKVASVSTLEQNVERFGDKKHSLQHIERS
jgi:hypothetical protein